jgi:hypothetical protein
MSFRSAVVSAVLSSSVSIGLGGKGLALQSSARICEASSGCLLFILDHVAFVTRLSLGHGCRAFEGRALRSGAIFSSAREHLASSGCVFLIVHNPFAARLCLGRSRRAFDSRAGGLGRRSRFGTRFADEFLFVMARPIVPVSFLRLMPVD